MFSFDATTGLMVPFPVVWSWADESAQPLGVRHQYGSLNWTKQIADQSQIGEIPGAARPYNKGLAAPGLGGTNH
jgi:hypothetical protein